MVKSSRSENLLERVKYPFQRLITYRFLKILGASAHDWRCLARCIKDNGYPNNIFLLKKRFLVMGGVGSIFFRPISPKPTMDQNLTPSKNSKWLFKFLFTIPLFLLTYIAYQSVRLFRCFSTVSFSSLLLMDIVIVIQI